MFILGVLVNLRSVITVYTFCRVYFVYVTIRIECLNITVLIIYVLFIFHCKIHSTLLILVIFLNFLWRVLCIFSNGVLFLILEHSLRKM